MVQFGSIGHRVFSHVVCLVNWPKYFNFVKKKNMSIEESGIMRTSDEFEMSGMAFTNFCELNRSSYCRVIKAKRQGRWWVLKALLPEHTNTPFYKSLLYKEFQILSQMHHPHIVMCVSMETVDGYGQCIVMDFIDGLRLGEKDYQKSDRISLAFQLIDAVEYIHSLQIVHRDLKPSNILVSDNGTNVHIIDFGLADTDSHAILKQPAGTRSYMAPEQLIGDHPDVRNDIYSLGCVFKEMKLGWQYAPIISKMLKSIDRRYQTSYQVKRSMKRARMLPLIAGGLLVVIATALITGLTLWHMYPQHKEINAKDFVSTERADGISNKLDSAQHIIDSMQIVIDQTSLKSQQMQQIMDQEKQHKDEYTQASNEVKIALDKYMTANRYLALARQYKLITNKNEADSLLFTIANIRNKSFSEVIPRHIKQYKNRFTDSELSTMQHELWDYLDEKYPIAFISK